MSSLTSSPSIPYFLGHFAIYATSIYTAREIYDKIADGDPVAVSGMERTFSGEQIKWTLLKKKSERVFPARAHDTGH
jgi:hypothetical protein